MEKLLERAEEYITDLVSEQAGTDYLFHNLARIKEVVENAEKILSADASNASENEITMLAAWFLDAGIFVDYDEPAKKSSDLAESFLKQEKVEDRKIEKVCKLIRILGNKEEPADKQAEVLHDAYTGFYGSKNFHELMELHRMELQNFHGDVPSLSDWRERYLEILRTKHRYFTAYAKENWQERKEKNISKLVAASTKAIRTKRKEKLKVKFKNESPERAIQSLYRTQLRNHIKLSDIADTKANILLSVNAIIISLLMANLIPKLDDPKNSYLIYPTVIFVIFSIASIIMSVLATRPKIENESMVDGNIDEENTNYLFFGNFYSLELQNFKARINKIIESKESIYDSLTMDLYFLGKVLKKKYQLLRWTYTIFIIGIILSVIAFAIALKYYGMGQEILDAVTPEVPE